MTDKRISRRNFLKVGCLTTAATGLTIGGLAFAHSEPEIPKIEYPSFSYGEPNMNKRILIVYASETGSTVDVASEIGNTLAGDGWMVDVQAVQKKPQLAGYQAVLIGSAVQYGKWLPEALDYVNENKDELAGLPLALFCVHIRNIGDDETSRLGRLAYLDPIRSIVKPDFEGYFAGRFNAHGAMLMMPRGIARFIPTMDFRKWNKIRAWAQELHLLLLEA